MPIDLKEFSAPTTSALLIIECQQAVIGKYAPEPLKELGEVARQRNIVPNIAKLAQAARVAGAKVLHMPAYRRPDGLGSVSNTRLAAALKKRGHSRVMTMGSEGASNMPGLEPEEGDFTLWRSHAMTSFHDTGLDSLCRNMGIQTIIPTGVSLNVAITGATIEAVNRNYKCVIPTDCVAGFPAEYGDMVIRHALIGLAALTTADELAKAWGVDWDSL